MLATAATALPPDDEQWAYELKWDGVRAVAYVEHGALHLESRNLNDITPRYPELLGLARSLSGHAVVLDGEVVAFDAAGRPSFQRLQARMHLTREREVAARMVDTPIVYLVFDVLHLDGESTRGFTWDDRRRVLEALELAGPAWQTPRAHVGDGDALLAASRAGGVEGVVAKRRTSVYTPGRRSRDWLKVKNQCRQEFVVGGWVPGAGNREGRVGALLLGYYDDDDVGALRFAGKVGTGFTSAELSRLERVLAPLVRPTSPFADPVRYRDARFTEPVLVADVEFTEWTDGHTLRHPSYKGQRDDKDPREVRRET